MIKIDLNNNELIIKGNKLDLLEFSKHITLIAESEQETDHLHLDDLTLIDKESKIKNLIIEKTK